MFKIPITHIVLYFIFYNKYIYSDEINKITVQTKIILLSTQKKLSFFLLICGDRDNTTIL